MNFKLSKVVYTLGASTRSGEEFIELLTSHSVKIVVDVRRFPSSRFECFRRENLAGLLSEAGIDYVYMGGLGGYRRGGYQNFTTTSEFQMGWGRMSIMDTKPFMLPPAWHSISGHKLQVIRIPV